MRRIAAIFAVCGIVVSFVAAEAFAAEAVTPDFKIRDGGFTAEDGGFVISASGDGRLVSLKEYEPGQYIITGEYKTEGMEALAMFAVDVKSYENAGPDDKTASFSGYDMTCASPEWTPFVMYVTIDFKSAANLRVGNWQKCKGAESKLHVRGLQMKAQEWVDGANQLVNGDFEQSVPDYLPGNWYWKLGKDKAKTFPASNYSVIKNTTFKTGKNVLQMICGGNGDEVMLNSRSFNLPKAGDLELTFSAKAEKPCTIKPRIVQSWSKQYTDISVKVQETWKQFSVKYSVVPGTDRKTFFLRLDMPTTQEAKVEYADMKLIYHAPAGSTTQPAAAAAKEAEAPK